MHIHIHEQICICQPLVIKEATNVKNSNEECKRFWKEKNKWDMVYSYYNIEDKKEIVGKLFLIKN